ncbi:invasion associated locus B family protein [Bartonella australis AUST/NH1]|uniref:Invasion associated locus B family protein n=1 Tax=Bartonella australis (strain Aust/NH1) TaxID=1094489 RepID=M1NXP3_BARAA|nr:invasion associated locus B family protein [Bartonella australis]AGF74247.1 invasion associated locus B family protein [Bartonella australis AUST/NH1]
MLLHQFLKKIFLVGAIICALCSIFANHTVAQMPNAHSIPAPQTYGAWTKICSLPPGTPNMQCEAVQDVRTQDRRDITFRIAFYKLPGNKGTLMRVFAPILVELRPGILIKIDGKDIGKITYRRCLNNVCIAEALLKEDMLKHFLEGKTAIYSVFTTPEKGIGGLVDLNGLSDAYSALPM